MKITTTIGKGIELSKGEDMYFAADLWYLNLWKLQNFE